MIDKAALKFSLHNSLKATVCSSYLLFFRSYKWEKDITLTRLCNILQYFTSVKNDNFQMKTWRPPWPSG